MELKEFSEMVVTPALQKIVDAELEAYWTKTDYDTLKSAVINFLKLRPDEELQQIIKEVTGKDMTELSEETEEEIAQEWIACNPNDALSIAIEYGADKDELVTTWFDNANAEDIVNEASQYVDLRDLAVEAINNI